MAETINVIKDSNGSKGFIKLEEETGSFLLSGYGSGHALGFVGNPQFIERCRNFVANFGLSRNKLSSLGLDTIYYVTTTVERMKKALVEYYRAQVIINNLVPASSFETVEDMEFAIRDEAEVDKKSNELADNFILNKIIRTDFMKKLSNDSIHEYKAVI